MSLRYGSHGSANTAHAVTGGLKTVYGKYLFFTVLNNIQDSHDLRVFTTMPCILYTFFFFFTLIKNTTDNYYILCRSWRMKTPRTAFTIFRNILLIQRKQQHTNNQRKKGGNLSYLDFHLLCTICILQMKTDPSAFRM